MADQKEATGLKKIDISCDYTELVPLADLIPMQGELKVLEPKNYAKLKSSIIKYGFTQPICSFEHIENGRTCNILDGHQRRETCMKMNEEGFEILVVPVVWVKAESEKKAAEIIMTFVSQFGTVTKSGLIDFVNQFELNIDEIKKELRVPELNTNELIKGLAVAKIEDLAKVEAPQVEYPIVADFQEKYDAITIFCRNQQDFLQLKTMLGIEKEKSFKNENIGETRVIEYSKFYKNYTKHIRKVNAGEENQLELKGEQGNGNTDSVSE